MIAQSGKQNLERWPKITLVTPNLNQGAFLEAAIQSVLDQGYPRLEYFIVDGGSQDNSLGLIERYASRLSGYLCEPDEGQVDALQKGFAMGSGDLYGWLNADDRLLPGALQAVAAAYREAGQPSVLVGAGRMVDANGRQLFERWPDDLTHQAILQWRKWFMQAAVFFSAASYQAVGGFARDLDYAFDFDLWVRLSKQFRFVPVPCLLAEHARHADAKTERYRGRSYAETRLVQMRHGGSEYALQAIEELFLHDSELQRREQTRWTSRLRRGVARVLGGLGARLANAGRR
jgi:glycosyltransferase involved in cell wall biosynthesis